MRKIAILLIFLFFGINSFAQSTDDLYEQNFNIGMDVYNNFWMNLPDNVVQKGLNMGYSVYGMYNYQFKKSNFSFAGGAGITSLKFASNSVINDVKADVITFDTIANGINYDRSKITFSYFDIPVEFRYKTENNFRFALGVKLGFRLDNHSTYKGERLDGSEIGVTIKNKDIQHVEKILITSTLRIGYKWVNLNFNYALSKIFELERGPEIYPFSVGFTFMPF